MNRVHETGLRIRQLSMAVISLGTTLAAVPLAAQAPAAGTAPLALPVGAPQESYLRYAQTLGEVKLSAWTLRPFGPRELEDLFSSSPVAGPPRHALHRAGALAWQPLPASGTLWYNSTYPYGWNDGAVWRGRGATVAAEGGIAARWRWISGVIAPLAFSAENRAFELYPNGSTTNPFGDARRPTNIDRPQRFGPDAYSRFDWGQSGIRIDALGVTTGFTTQNMWVGPMSEWPYVLSNNAGGFPHVFMGSSRPWNVGIARVHGKVFYGQLAQSDYSSVPDSIGRRRFTTGFIGSISPRFLPGLEIGASRMIGYRWPKNGPGWREFRKPFETFLAQSVRGDSGRLFNINSDNQEASLFARWTLPREGFEVYAEMGREDHNWNGRDVILEPDHSATYGLGARKAMRRDNGDLLGLRTEIVSFDPSTLFRARVAGGGTKYAHGGTRQGHTQRGQVLGVGFMAIDGAGSMIAMDRFKPNGDQTSYSLSRLILLEQSAEPSVDVAYSFAADRVRRKGPLSLVYGTTVVFEMNRHFTADVGNVLLTTGVRW